MISNQTGRDVPLLVQLKGGRLGANCCSSLCRWITGLVLKDSLAAGNTPEYSRQGPHMIPAIKKISSRPSLAIGPRRSEVIMSDTALDFLRGAPDECHAEAELPAIRSVQSLNSVLSPPFGPAV